MQAAAAAGGDGRLWWRDLEAESTDYLPITDAGLEPGAERPQSIALDPQRTVYVGGGGGGIQIHELDSRNRPKSTRRIAVPGTEAKAMAVVKHKLYAAMYTTADIVELDPATDTARVVVEVGHEQERPEDMVYDPETELLLVASAPGGNRLQGALTVLDPKTDSFDVYHNIIPDEAVLTVTVADGVAYLGGDIHGDNPGDAEPTQPEAYLVAFDLATREVLWQIAPLPGQETIFHLAEHDGLLYGLMQRGNGNWFVLDLGTREVIQTGQIGGKGEIVVHRGHVYAITEEGGGSGSLYHLGPDLAEAQLLASGPLGRWYTDPQLAPELSSWYGWGVVGLNLARIRLDWRCPLARIGGC